LRPTDLELAALARARGWISGLVEEQALREADRCQAVGLSKPIEEILVGLGALTVQQVRTLRDELGWNLTRPRVGDYEIVRRIGLGGMGTVFEASHVRLKQRIALKILLPRYAQDEALARRFVEEGRALARLNDPHLVHAIDSGRDGEYYYLAMEYVEGEDLRQILSREGSLDVYSATLVVRDVVTALSALQTKGLVHRDVKPANVLISLRGEVKLGDLGLQKTAEVVGAGEERFVCGTPHYIAPEQIRRREDIDVRSDLYSLGATWFHLVCGRPPFTGSTTHAILRAHRSQKPRFPPECRSRIPAVVREAILRWLSKDRELRPSSAAAAVAEVDRVVSQLRPRSRPWARIRGTIGRSLGSPVWRWTFATFAVAVLVAVVVGVVLLSRDGEEAAKPGLPDPDSLARPAPELPPPRRSTDESPVAVPPVVAEEEPPPPAADPPRTAPRETPLEEPAPVAPRPPAPRDPLLAVRVRYEGARRVLEQGVDQLKRAYQQFDGLLRAHEAMVSTWTRDFHAARVAVEPRGALPLEVILQYGWNGETELADFRAVPQTWGVEDGRLVVLQGPFGVSLDTVAWFATPIRIEGHLETAAHLVVGFGNLRVAPGRGADGRVWSQDPGRDEVSVLAVPFAGPGPFEVVVTAERVLLRAGEGPTAVDVATPRAGRVLLRMEKGARLDTLRIEAPIEPHWGQARLGLLR
jgi:serine/threonine protein kinase